MDNFETNEESPVILETVRKISPFRQGDLQTNTDRTEFAMILSGSGICRVMDLSLPCGEGEVFLIPPGVPFSYHSAETGDTVSYFRIAFRSDEWFGTERGDDNYCFGIFRDGAPLGYAKLTQKTQEEVMHLTEKLREELLSRAPEWHEAVRSLLSLLLITVSRYVSYSIREGSGLPQKERLIISSVLRIVGERFRETDLTLDAIASALYISPSVLSRMFAQQMGQPFSDYVRTFRMEQACRLLKETEEPIGTVVSLCGLRDVPTFYRTFSRCIGMTPNQYRMKMTGELPDTENREEENITGILNEISATIQEGKAKVVREKVTQALSDGIDAKRILEEGLISGMDIIGEKFKNNEIYIPEVLVAARALNMGTQILKPCFSESGIASVGRACIGTVEGDLHDIGKNLVKMMMEGKQIEVIDLGSDVPAETFIRTAIDQNCRIICLSALLTTTMEEMRRVVKAAEEAGIRDKVKIMIGGAPVNENFRRQIGADIYTVDAASAAQAAYMILTGKNE